MTNDAEEASKVSIPLGAKTALYNLQKWRENQFQNFRNKQFIEHQNLIEESEKKKRTLKEYLENNKAILPKNQILDQPSPESELQDSSLTGHFLRCFSDSSGDSSTLIQSKADNHKEVLLPKGVASSNGVLKGKDQWTEEYLKPDPANAVPKRPKRPFLKKGSGLLRYTSEGRIKRDISTVDKSTESQATRSDTSSLSFAQSDSQIKSVINRNKSPIPKENNVEFNESTISLSSDKFKHKQKAKEVSKVSVVCDNIRSELIQNKSDGNQLELQVSKQKTSDHQPGILSTTSADKQSKPAIKLKSATSRNKSPSRQVSHVQFSEPTIFVSNERFKPEEQVQEVSKVSEVKDDMKSEKAHNESDRNGSKLQDFKDKTSSQHDISSTENKELADFLMLEKCAQNSSFNSDSSIVQRLIHGELVQKSPVKESNDKRNLKDFENIQTSNEDAPITFANINFSKFLQEVHAKKQEIQAKKQEIDAKKQKIQDLISDGDLRITSLQREISDSNTDPCRDMDDECSNRSSTPILYQNNHAQLSPIPEVDTIPNSSLDSSKFVPTNETSIVVEGSNSEIVDAAKKDHNYAANSEQKECTHDLQQVECSYSNIPIRNHEFSKKIIELDNEINIYQNCNAGLRKAIKEFELKEARFEKRLKDFENYKEKFHLEIENERKFLKRQKESFNRYQKLHKDNPARKEREELSVLRHEVIKSKEDQKRLQSKLTSEIRRLKNQIAISERERDSVKLKNMAIEENCKELLAIIKGTKSKKKNAGVQTNAEPEVEKSSTEDTLKASDDGEYNYKTQLENMEQNQTDTDNSDTSSEKPRVRFNLIPEFEDSVQNDFFKLTEKMAEHVVNTFIQSEVNDPVQNEHVNLDHMHEMCKDPLGKDLGYKEIKVGDKLERIYPSGAREIILPSGTQKYISADGKTIKVFFFNGDVKEILPNNITIYRYANGIVETHLPSGEEIAEYPNGQIQKLLPNGAKEIQYPDSSIQIIRPNGLEEMIDKDGTKVMVYPSGMEEIHFKNGKTIICTSEYKQKIYSDGSKKSVFVSGRKEIRYPDGRIRVKCKGDNPVTETKHIEEK